uniref:Uncharacterized protein n=1 Tax=Romanomermis culicivorax TaxID=13658 RepID=A0A915L292_ROMCU
MAVNGGGDAVDWFDARMPKKILVDHVFKKINVQNFISNQRFSGTGLFLRVQRSAEKSLRKTLEKLDTSFLKNFASYPCRNLLPPLVPKFKTQARGDKITDEEIC